MNAFIDILTYTMLGVHLADTFTSRSRDTFPSRDTFTPRDTFTSRDARIAKGQDTGPIRLEASDGTTLAWAWAWASQGTGKSNYRHGQVKANRSKSLPSQPTTFLSCAREIFD